ncbi:uncharacterized protein [Chironomus tepperi]|uniref:uncharacterized protein n=1 Tax=Chironomus tepperi TaxID=113505 RepID=UPI00391EF758
MNVNILIIFCGIFWIQCCVDAQYNAYSRPQQFTYGQSSNANCVYGIRYFKNLSYINPYKPYYYCYLRANLQSAGNEVTTISGQHNSGYTDDYVSNLYIPNDSSINRFTSIFCQKFKNLEIIESTADIQSIDGNSLEKCENLDILEIKGTRVNYIPSELLIRNSKLSGIFLWNNHITALPENLFSSKKNLKILNLQQNQIEYLPSNIFNSLTELHELVLNNNKLQLIDTKWFRNLSSLKKLVLGENQIAEIPDKSFEFMTNLEELHLHKNRIKLLNPNSFVGLHNLKILGLHSNEITDLPHNSFEPLKNLERLSLISNSLAIIDAASFGVHKNLVDIYLGSNRIDQIDEKFINNTAVNRMDMRNNICSNEVLRGTKIKVGLKTCFENYKTTKTQHEVTRTHQCGQPIKGTGNIIGGKNFTRGDFPWVAVLSTSSGEYICGGTLVTSRKVVTAAHCIQEKDAEKPKLPREIIIQLGAYDLDRKIEVGRISHAVQSINIHPDWNPFTQSYDADIAVLVLDPEVNFSEFIQPICLVQDTSASSGVVVGYGLSEVNATEHEKIPKMIETPIQSNKDCFKNNRALAGISSGRTFCGGTGTGVGVCNGDSGSGLFVDDGTTYYLRGIVSSSLLNVNRECNVDNYSVFTDVTKYIDWINGVSINRIDLIVFCGILWMQSCVDAQSADCDYKIRNYMITGYLNQNKPYYSCYLSTKLQRSINTVTTINGQLNTGRTDDDVRYLYISSDNSINTFSSTYCQKFKNLEVIQSYAADMNSIDGNSLEKCENLDVLSLNRTQLNSIPNELLTRNSKLSKIMIKEGQVTTLPENLFLSQNKLKLLILVDNQINFLPSNIFNPLIQLEYLDLHNNKLQSIDSKWFKNLGNLKWLYLNGNQISLVPDKSFEIFTNLEVLSLDNNRIKLLYSNSFAGLHNLKKLYIYNNEISGLPHNTFEPLTNLELLSMYSNKLATIDAASFGVHKNLFTVGLQNNKINQIDEKFIDKTAVNWMNMTDNICSNEVLRGTKIKVGLKTCFENYKATKTQPVDITRTYQCGQPVKGVGNIIGGRFVTRGNFPWVAVLSRPSGDVFCGGTLVTSRKVVSAAHCIQDKETAKPTLAGEIVIQLGAYDLDKKVEIGRAFHAVQRVNIHPDWNTLTQAFDADISVLVLEREAAFSEFIQPICLGRASSASTGVVVGYGKSEDDTKIHETIPKILETPIHSNKDCFKNNRALAGISSGRTFCGGTGTGVGVCRGDSGSGLFVNDGTTYYLRGVVSSSLIGGPYGCDVDTYSVFTDVTKYIDWINGVSINRFE